MTVADPPHRFWPSIKVSGNHECQRYLRVGQVVIWDRPLNRKGEQPWGRFWWTKRAAKTKPTLVRIHRIGKGWNDVEVVTGEYCIDVNFWELRTEDHGTPEEKAQWDAQWPPPDGERERMFYFWRERSEEVD